MPFFHTGLILKPNEVEKALQLLEGEISIAPDPTKRFWASSDGVAMSYQTSFETREDYIFNIDNMVLCYELQISAKSSEEAFNILSIIKAGMYLGYPELLQEHGLPFPIEVTKSSINVCNTQPFWSQFIYDDKIDIGLFTYKAAKDDTQRIYALEKYKLSLEQDSITPHSGHPKYGQIFENESSMHSTHVKQLTSVILAYSVIEEIGCEIRASEKNPRFIKGKWNPEVWDETINRLEKKGIAVDEKFVWIFRGDDTPIHKEFTDDFGVLANYNDENIVRDRELHIIEAIQFASYLRNFVAAHRFNEKSKYISPYDVYNVQMLARKLLMQSMGIWSYVRNNA
ncbi:hypothetical protein [Sulfuricurvum sp.]|uniref:hypothetical protein n=1 Tax=Sulfuricurvum sp. TaxID=2025608 RepID=UPI002E36593D|nr:hypothetical protein [Sulfuricurvum sp.]HEX5328768.1 hypothetical protein [Sulfuricurvum sp.]